jgi:hypothetical protein
VFYLLATVGLAVRLGTLFDCLWLLADALLISGAVYATGGVESSWYIWYLPSIGGAAFVLGQWGAFAVFVVDTAALLVALRLLGQVDALGPDVYVPVARMVFLYGASFCSCMGWVAAGEAGGYQAHARRRAAGRAVRLTCPRPARGSPTPTSRSARRTGSRVSSWPT